MMNLPASLDDLFSFDPVSRRVSSREGKHREFKLQFDRSHFSSYTKVLAAFSNTDGGTLVFGVAERPRRLEGVDPATIPDEAQWTDRLRRDFDPEIPLEIREYQAAGQSVVAVGVDRHIQRPVICKRNATVRVQRRRRLIDQTLLQQGTIYYRQSGQIRPIAFAELQLLLQERDERRLQAFFENLQIMQKIGPERVGLIDASTTAAPGQNTRLYVSREVAKSLNFIDKGRFVETEEAGSPAYFLAGTVELNEVIERPIDDADRNLPTEAAHQIRPLVQELYGDATPFTGQHLAKLATHLNLRRGEETDQRYCLYDNKIKRYFYPRAGIQHITDKLREDPGTFLPAFASKATVQAYEARER